MSVDNSYSLEVSPEFDKKIKAFNKDWTSFYKKISKEKTPQVDGTGRKIIDKKGSYDFIINAYMVECLDKHFPGWSWENAAPLQVLGTEWIVAQGTLCIIDFHLLAFGINPPYRKFYGCGAARIQYPQGQAHDVRNIIDINNNVKSANTEALKVAINRLTHIGDDVYGKRIEEEGMGSLEDVALVANDATAFLRWVTGMKLKPSAVTEILGCEIKDITDFPAAIKKIKEAKDWK